jgi:hypothetical protein
MSTAPLFPQAAQCERYDQPDCHGTQPSAYLGMGGAQGEHRVRRRVRWW